MKEKIQIEIADVPLSIITDEKEDYVKALVEKLDREIRDLTVRNKRCSKTDAALLVALDYCSEKQKADKRVRNLEAQISLYDVNLRRMREENAALRERLEAASAAASDVTPAGETEDKPAEEPGAAAVEDVEASADDVEAPAAPAEKPAEKKADEPAPSPVGKMRQLEMMLQGMRGDKN